MGKLYAQPLIPSVSVASLQPVVQFIKSGENVNEPINPGQLLLWISSRKGHPDRYGYLPHKGVAVKNYIDDSATSPEPAAIKRHPDLVALQVLKGVDPGLYFTQLSGNPESFRC